MTPSLRYEIDQDRVGILTINRPSVRNALSWEAMEDFAVILQSIKADDALHALILTGEGNAFCAGGDLFELHPFTSHADGERLAALMADALMQLAALPFPVIAAIEGPAIGGGAEIAMACDLRLMSQSAHIGFPQIRLALIPTWGGTLRLLELVGYSRAFALLSTGKLLGSQEAYELGLIQRIVPDGQALEASQLMAKEFSTIDQTALRALKTVLRAHLTLPAPEATELERVLFADLWSAQAHIEASTRFTDGLQAS